MPAIITHLWFDMNAEEAAEFYCSVFPDSRVTSVNRTAVDTPSQPAGDVVTVGFELDGTPFVGINGGPQFPFTPAVSLEIRCSDQAEVDHYWSALTSGGGSESQCGRLTDRYGFSWQVVPEVLYQLWQSPEPEVARRVGEVVMGSVKLDVAEIEAATGPGAYRR